MIQPLKSKVHQGHNKVDSPTEIWAMRRGEKCKAYLVFEARCRSHCLQIPASVNLNFLLLTNHSLPKPPWFPSYKHFSLVFEQ